MQNYFHERTLISNYEYFMLNYSNKNTGLRNM
uniref:Uncharacterized protein n=1 Tax=Anguilla anguilla TaxID=7936 RepID=A0A0E9Q2L8_ANGAN